MYIYIFIHIYRERHKIVTSCSECPRLAMKKCYFNGMNGGPNDHWGIGPKNIGPPVTVTGLILGES